MGDKVPEITFETPEVLIWIRFTLSETANLEKVFADFPDLKAFRQLEAKKYELVVYKRGSDYEGIVRYRLTSHNIRLRSIDLHNYWRMYVTLSTKVKSTALREQMLQRVKKALGQDVSASWISDELLRISSMTRTLTKEDFSAIRMALAT